MGVALGQFRQKGFGRRTIGVAIPPEEVDGDGVFTLRPRADGLDRRAGLGHARRCEQCHKQEDRCQSYYTFGEMFNSAQDTLAHLLLPT